MSKTYGKDEIPKGKYQRAVTEEVLDLSNKTNSSLSKQRFIATSCIDGSIEVIIVNKPQSSKNIDKSTH